jgi:hypothetical protein
MKGGKRRPPPILALGPERQQKNPSTFFDSTKKLCGKSLKCSKQDLNVESCDISLDKVSDCTCLQQKVSLN